MTVRERFLAMGVLGFITLAGVVVIVLQFIVTPLKERKTSIDKLKGEIAEKRDRIFAIQAEKPKLELWRKQSLPADVGLARLEYEKYLRELSRQSGFEASNFSVIPKELETRTGILPAAGKKEPPLTSLTFSVKATGELAELVDFLERFYRTPLLHEIKSMNITRSVNSAVPVGGPFFGPRAPQQPKNELTINMNIEALVLREADTRKQLLPGVDRHLAGLDVVATLSGGPAGLALLPWAVGPTGPLGPGVLAVPAREYAAIAGKDIFYGPPAVEQVAENYETSDHVFLTDITRTGTKVEAFLYTRFNNTKTRLRASAGFDTFRIRNSKGETLAQGKVIRIEDRDVIFLSDDKYYSMHVGQNLEEVLKHPLEAIQIKELGLTAAASNGSTK